MLRRHHSLVLALAVVLGACGSSSDTASDTTAAAPVEAAVETTAATEAGAVQASAETSTAVAGADTTAAAAAGAATVPTAKAVCDAVPLASVSEIFGVTFTGAVEDSISPDFPSCRYEAEGGGQVRVTICCSNMTEPQIASSIALNGSKELGPNTVGLVRGPDDDVKLAQLMTYRNNILFDLSVSSIGAKTDLGFSVPGEPELNGLVKLVEQLAAGLA